MVVSAPGDDPSLVQIGGMCLRGGGGKGALMPCYIEQYDVMRYDVI